MANNPHLLGNSVSEEKACGDAEADGCTGACHVYRKSPIWLNDIRARAHQKWQEAGKPDGDNSRFWLEAEQELLQGQCSKNCQEVST
ncbi:MAG TPA: DUF2934 domain-containing protein [Gemmataceae bacterium]|nr:DUF2934 domain-containing protein [Gemmataceae bacterium]